MGSCKVWGSWGRVGDGRKGVGGWVRREGGVEEAEDEPIGGGAESGC